MTALRRVIIQPNVGSTPVARVRRIVCVCVCVKMAGSRTQRNCCALSKMADQQEWIDEVHMLCDCTSSSSEAPQLVEGEAGSRHRKRDRPGLVVFAGASAGYGSGDWLVVGIESTWESIGVSGLVQTVRVEMHMTWEDPWRARLKPMGQRQCEEVT
jgi:hypothetical protein